MIDTTTDQIEMHPSVYVAPTARIIGRVKIGAGSSVWDGAVIRGDLAPIEIGENTSIQENAVIHVDTGIPTKIGSYVTVGHGAVVHGATIDDYCIIAIHSTILNRAEIGSYCIVGAGSVVMERRIIPPRSVVFGIPGKVHKPVNEEMQRAIEQNARNYMELGAAYLRKSV